MQDYSLFRMFIPHCNFILIPLPSPDSPCILSVSLSVSLLPALSEDRCWLLTSDLPRRSLLEMSKVSPVAAVSTPPVPLFCSLRFSRIFENRGSWERKIRSSSIKMIYEPLIIC